MRIFKHYMPSILLPAVAILSEKSLNRVDLVFEYLPCMKIEYILLVILTQYVWQWVNLSNKFSFILDKPKTRNLGDSDRDLSLSVRSVLLMTHFVCPPIITLLWRTILLWHLFAYHTRKYFSIINSRPYNDTCLSSSCCIAFVIVFMTAERWPPLMDIAEVTSYHIVAHYVFIFPYSYSINIGSNELQKIARQ